VSRKVACPRCDSPFAHRDQALEHAEKQHGDYISLRTRDEFLALLKETGEGDLELTNLIPKTAFLPVAQLKRWMRAGQAESDLYGVRAGVKRKRRKRKANCPTCGEPVGTKFGKKYHRGCRPSAYERKRPDKLKTEDSAPIIRKRRQRCAAPDCDALFYPESKRQRYHSTKCADKARSKRFRLRAEPQ